MNRRSFFKHAVCILFLVFAMGQVWGTDYISAGDGNWNRPLQYVDNNRTWTYNIWANGQYPKDDTNDNVTITHNVTVPAGCTDAKANAINVNAGSLSCVGSGKLTANTVNVNNGGSLVYTSGMTVNSINVESGGKIVLNAWPTPAPTFKNGCIVEIGPSFPTDATTLLALKRAMDGKLLSVTITTAQTLANVGTNDYDTITIKAGGRLTVPAGVTVKAKRLVIEGDGTSANPADYGEMIVNGSFVANVQDASSNYIGRTINSGKLTVGTGGEFDSNYSVNEEKGVVTANGFFKSGNLHNKGTIIENDIADHSTNANCCKVVNDGEMIFGDSTRFLVYNLSDGDFDGTFTNKGKVTFGNSVHSEYSTSFTNAEDGTVEIGTNTEILFTENNGIFSNAGILTVKKDAAINKRDVQTGCTFTNTGYLIREKSKIFEYTSDANTLWIENRLAAAKDYELTSDADLVLNVAGNINLLVGDDTNLNSLNLYSRNHGIAGIGPGKEHTIESDFTVTVKNKTASTGKLTLETISISRTSQTPGVKGTLDLSSEVKCNGAIAISSGTELDINADVSAVGISQNILSSNTTIKIGEDKTFTTSGNVTFPSNLSEAANNKHCLFSSKGTVVVEGDGKSFQIDTTEDGDGLGNITFKAGGSLTANSLAGNTLTVNTTGAQTFTLNSNVTFADVILEGSSGKELSVAVTGDSNFSITDGSKSLADYVKFQSSDHPAIKKGGQGAGIVATNSNAPGTPQKKYPEGWLDGDKYFVWKGTTDTTWATATNWFRNNSPTGKANIEKITIDTTGTNNPVLATDVTTKELEFKNSKSANLSGSTLTVEILSGTGTLNLGSGKLQNGEAAGTEITVPGTLGLKFGDASTETSTILGKFKIQKVVDSTGTLNVGDSSTASEVNFATGSDVKLGSVVLSKSDSKISFGKNVALSGSLTNSGSATFNGAFSSTGAVTNSGTITGEKAFTVGGAFSNSGTLTSKGAFTADDDFTNASGGTVAGAGAFTFKGAFSDSGTWNGAGNFTFGAGTEKVISGVTSTVYPFTTVTGNAKFVTDFTIGGNGLLINGGAVNVDTGKTLTVNKNVSKSSGTLSGSGTIKIKGNFNDAAGTTSISEIVFFGDNAHAFTTVAGYQYGSVKLDSSILSGRNFTVNNNAKITTFTDESSQNNVTFNGTAAIGTMVANDSSAYTFINDATIGSLTDGNGGSFDFKEKATVNQDVIFRSTVTFRDDATFQNTATPPVAVDANFGKSVTFTKDGAKLTGKDLTFEKAVSFPANGNNTIIGNDVNFKDNVSANNLSVIAANLTLNTTSAAPAITFTATNLTLTGAGTTLKHGTTGNKIIITGSLVSDTTLAVSDPLEVSGAVTVNAGKSISANGTLKTGTTLENNGTFTGSDTITVGTSLTNTGTFTGNGTLSVGTYLTNSGTFTGNSTITVSGDFTNINAFTGNDSFTVRGAFTNSGSLTGNSTITVGTTLTNSGTVKSKSTITVTGNCTNNSGGIISDVDASNKGELHLKANFTDGGTTSISKVKFLGATHEFVPGTSEYKEIELAKEVTSLTVKTNDISFTNFTDTQDSSAGRTVTFNKNVFSKADNIFYAKVVFDGNVTFQADPVAPATNGDYKNGTFNGTVTFSKSDATITGKNLTFEKSVTFPSDGTNTITAEELSFKASVTSGNLNIAADKMSAKEITAKIPGTPGNPDVIKTVTLQTKNIELSSASTPETVKINGKLDSSVSLTLKDDVYVSSDVKLTGNGKALSVDTGKKLLCGHDFRANGISISGDVAIKSNENWEECFAEAVNCDISNSTVYFWNGNLTNSGFSGDGTKARIPCENCTDSGNNSNWQFDDIEFVSAKTVSDCEIELIVKDKASDFMTGSTLTAFVNASGTNHTGSITNSSAITYTVTGAKADPADANQAILTLKTNGGTWNTDSTGTSTGNTYSTDRNGLQQTELPVIKIERGTGGNSESYTITNKWGKRFASYDGTTNPVFDQTTDGASPVLIHVYTGQENHVAASTGNQQNYDAHNFLEFVYSEPVSLYKNADKPTGLASGTPYMASGVVDNLQSVAGDLGAAVNNGSGVIITGIANFSQGKLVTKKHVSGALDTADTTLNVFYRKAADDNSTSFRWGLASFANATPLVAGTDSFVDFAGYIDEVQLFGGTISAPSSVDALIFDAEKNPGNMVRPGLAIETARTSGGVGVAGTADNTIGTWDIKGPDFVPVRKQGDVWSDVPSTVKNYEIAGTARGAATTLSGVEFHFFDNQPEYSAADEAEWFIRTGWTDSSGNLKLTESYAADIFGGSRMFADSSSRTGGGIRYSSLRKAVDEGVFTYRTVNSHGNTSVNYSSFGNVITPGEKALIFSSLDRGNTRNVQTFDSPYFGLEMPGSTNELRTTFEITYTESKGVLTDLAGNKLVCPEGKRVVHSVDMTPPDFSLTVAAIGSKKLFVLFSKKIQVDKIIFRDASDNIVPFSSTALEDIPKSLGFATITNKQRPVPVTSIQIDESVPAKVICSTDNNTGLELTLTKEATFENMENLFLVVKNVPGLANLRDPITGIVTQLSFVQDELGNYMSENQAHIFSDFAVNLVSPVYAYSTGEQVDGETVFENFYGDGNYSVHDFTREQQNFGTMITGGDMIIVSNTDKAITSAKQIKLWASVNPSDGSVSNELNATASLDLRVWLPTVVLPLAKNYNKNVFGVLGENLNSSGIRDGIKTTIPQTSGFGDGDTVSFLFEVMNTDGTTRKFCHSPKLNIDGTLSLDESDDTVVGPLYVLNQLDPNDILSLDLWSFKLKTPVSQRGGVSILNNVINSGLGEKTMVKVDVPAAVSDITVMVLTLDGNVIKYLHTGPEKAGTHYYDWDGSNLAGKAVARGMYFIRVVGNGFDETRKVMVVK